jgi:hypothetical protein
MTGTNRFAAACLWLLALRASAAAAPAAGPENLALRARATASSEAVGSANRLPHQHRAQFACDGKIARALKHMDCGMAWAADGNNHPDGVTFTLAWDEEVTIAELVYYGRTAWGDENMKDYEVSVGADPAPVLKGTLKSGHGPQRMKLPKPVRTSSVRILFRSHHGGGCPGAAEIQAYAESPPDELLGEFVTLDKIPPCMSLVRFKLVEPAGTTFYVKLAGYIHVPPWYLPAAVWPEKADADADKRVAAGEFTPWFDLGKHAGGLIHRRMHLSGGVAELPNVTVDFLTTAPSDSRTVVIQLAEQPDEKHIVKEFAETLRGSLTSFLVSPDLLEDSDSLETAAQMSDRRLAWARAATGGKRATPEKHLIQTGFWMPQRPELNLREAEVLSLLGFNAVVGDMPEVAEKYPWLRPAANGLSVDFGPAQTRESVDARLAALAKSTAPRHSANPGVPFHFNDEIACPPMGTDAPVLAAFRAWLGRRGIRPQDLGVETLDAVQPIETPPQLRERAKAGAAAANRIFYFTARFRQESATERIRWATEAFHRYFPPGPVASTLVADHPYFGGTGLGMGMVPNTTWGGHPLAIDWFDLGRRQAVDMASIEDWMGLQYMFGPNATWEGFQLMGFQSAIFRSAGRGRMPIQAWITPSDETNLVLKASSSLCQGAKHFFYWTYGPTATSTENYWSDLRGEYDGIARISRQLAAAEPITGPGTTRPTKVALLYSISSDLWQPFGYIHMLERRATYLSLVHGQYLVDLLTEEDIEAGRLADYAVLYATDPNITEKATGMIAAWVRAGGFLHASCAAGSRNEFDEDVAGLAPILGIRPGPKSEVQRAEYRLRCGLNPIPWLDEISLTGEIPGAGGPLKFGIVGTKVAVTPQGGKVVGTFKDGGPAVVVAEAGRGRTICFAGCPGLSYLKDAGFVATELKEKYPAVQRSAINAWARAAGAPPLVELSSPVVEAGIYDAAPGAALVLANFTYEPIDSLAVALPVARPVRAVASVESGTVAFSTEQAPPALRAAGFPQVVRFAVPLKLNDVVLASYVERSP